MRSLLLLLLLVFTGPVFSQEPMRGELRPIPDRPARFPGGDQAMKTYIVTHMVYPESAKEAGISGRCYTQFTVLEDGSITDVRVLRGVEAARNATTK